MEIVILTKEHYTIIKPLEEITVFNNNEFKKHLSEIIESTQLPLVLDLEHIRGGSSIFISALLWGLRKMAGRDFFLINVSEEILMLLKLANIINKFRILENYDELA